MPVSVGSLIADLGFRVDDDGAQRFERRLRSVREDVRKPVTAELRGDYDKRDLDLYERKLNEVRAKVKRREDFKAKLGADYDARAFRAYERDIGRAERDNDRLIKSHGRLRTAFGSVWSSGGAAFAAAGGAYALVTAVKSVTGAYGESEVSAGKLKAQLAALDISYEKHAKRIDTVIQKTSQLAGLDDEDLQDAFTNIVRVTGDVNKSLRLTGLAADFARAKQMDVAKAGELLGKVAGGNVGILSRYGLSVEPVTKAQDKLAKSTKDATAEQTKAAKETDKQATTQKALASLQERFAGQAAQYGKSQTGALERLSVAWENLREKLGEKLAPLITRLANRMADFIAQFAEGRGKGGEFREELGRIVDKLKGVVETGKDVVGFLKEHKELLKTAAALWVSYKVAVVAAGIAAKGSGLLGRVRGVAAPAAAAGAGTSAATTAAGGAAAGGAASRFARGAGGLTAGAAIFAAFDTFEKFGNGPDIGLLQEVVGKFSTAEEGLAKMRKRIDELARAGDTGGMRKLAEQLRDIAEANADATRGDHLKKFADQLEQAAKTGGRAVKDLGREHRDVVKNMRGNWRDLRDSTDTTMKDVREQVRSSTRMIKTRLGKDTEEGKDALRNNFRQARRAIRDSMKDGTVDVRDGLKEIRRLMVAELKTYGLTGNQARQYMRSDSGDYRGADNPNPGGGHARGGYVRRAVGGWIGQRGMVSGDVVPIAPGVIAAYGEYDAHSPGGRRAVLNRHQAPFAELALAMGGYPGLDQLPAGGQLPILERALAPLGGLDGLFAAVRRPHYLARGGIVPVPGFPGERANTAILDEIASVTKRWPSLRLTDAFGPGHKSPGHTVTGTAADFSGPDAAMDAAVKALVARGYLVGYDGRFGSQNWPGHGPSTRTSNFHFHVEFGGAGQPGGLGAASDARIKRVRTGIPGALGAVVQGALDMTRAGATRTMRRAIESSLAVPVGGGGTGVGPGAGSATRAQMVRWARLALERTGIFPATNENIEKILTLARKESSWKVDSINLWDSNAKAGNPSGGLMHVTIDKVGGSKARLFDPVANMIASIRYQSARYGNLVTFSPYARGGWVQRLASGGRARQQFAASQARGQAGAAEAVARAEYSKPRVLQKRLGRRIGAFDDVIDDIAGLERTYEQRDRKFGLSEEELIDPETGQVNVAAVEKRAGELDKLAEIRKHIAEKIKQARRVARRVIRTYESLLRRLRGQLPHAKKKERGGIRGQIRDYQGALREYRGQLEDLGFDLTDARLDLKEVKLEAASVRGTQAEPADAGDTGDTGDTGEPTEPETRAPTAEEIALAAQEQLRSFQGGVRELFAGFGRNARPVGATGAPSEFETPAAFGATPLQGGVGIGTPAAGGVQVGQIVQNFAAPPPDPFTYTKQLAFETGAVG